MPRTRTAGSPTAGLSILEELDGELAAFERRMPRGTGLLVTADHGVIDVPAHRHVFIDASPELLEGVRHVGGSRAPRPSTSTQGLYAGDRRRSSQLARRRGTSRVVMSRDEAIDAGLYGPGGR